MPLKQLSVKIEASGAKAGADTTNRALDSMGAHARGADAALTGIDRKLSIFGRTAQGVGSRLGGYLAFGAITLGARAAIAELGQLEKKQIQIENTMGLNAAASKRQIEGLLDASLRLPQATAGVVDLAQTLYQVGFRDDLVKQTELYGRELERNELATRAGVLALSQYAAATGQAKEAIRQINADLNTLGDEFAAQPEKVLRGATELTFALKQYKVTSDAALALATAIERIGGEAPQAAQGLSKIFSKADPAWIQQFKDGDAAVAALLQRLRDETERGTLGTFLEAAGLEDPRAAKSLGALATSADVYAQALVRVKDKQGNLNSTISQSERIAKSLESEMGNWRKTVDVLLFSQEGLGQSVKNWSQAARESILSLNGQSKATGDVADRMMVLQTTLGTAGAAWLVFGVSATTSLKAIGIAYTSVKIGEYFYSEFALVRGAADSTATYLIQAADLIELGWKNAALSIGQAALSAAGSTTTLANGLPDWLPGVSTMRGAAAFANAAGKVPMQSERNANIQAALESITLARQAADQIASAAKAEFANPGREGKDLWAYLFDPTSLAASVRDVMGPVQSLSAGLATELGKVETAAIGVDEATRLAASGLTFVGDSAKQTGKAIDDATVKLSAFDAMLRQTATDTRLLSFGPLNRSAATDAAAVRAATLEREPGISQADLDMIERATLQTRQAYYDMERLRNASDEAGLAIAGGFETAILQGQNFQDTLKGILQDLERIALNELFTKPLANGIGSGIFGALGGLFGGGGGDYTQSWYARNLPGRASGGPVYSGQEYLVGENGPELLRMGPQSGYVMPNVPDFNRSTSGAGDIHVTINMPPGTTPDADGMRRSARQIADEIRRRMQGRG
ncbi:MAG: hypothetical protein KF805_08415 [Phycisphaeraceae bacterium]|nr:hypothetical protein [Phycisphaeraceae bacterium]